MPPSAAFFLLDARIDPRRLSIELDGSSRTVEPLAMRILLVLVEACGRVVTREEIVDAVWPDGFAGEGSLSRAIWSLRQALGDDARSPRYIETVPRVGYRLKVEATPTEASAVADRPAGELIRANRRLKGWVAVLSVALVVVSTGWGIHAASDSPSYQQFLKVKRPDGSVDSLHVQSESPIAFSSNLLD